MKVGQLAGQAEGDGAVQIRIDAIEEGGERVEATVTACGDFFSANRLTGVLGSQGFVVGENLVLERRGRPAWVIVSPPNRPWHLLEEHADGTLIFGHYR